MDGDVENCDMSGGNCFMIIHTLSAENDPSYIDCKNKRDGIVPNVSEMGDSGLNDGVEIDDMFYASKRNLYSNTE